MLDGEAAVILRDQVFTFAFVEASREFFVDLRVKIVIHQVGLLLLPHAQIAGLSELGVRLATAQKWHDVAAVGQGLLLADVILVDSR